jgi:hypothetical protein
LFQEWNHWLCSPALNLSFSVLLRFIRCPAEGATCGVTNSSGFAHVNNSQVGQWNATLQFYRTLKEKYNTYLTVPDPYWMSGGTNKEPMGYTDAWNHIPSDANGTKEYLNLGRMYLYDGTYHKPTVSMVWHSDHGLARLRALAVLTWSGTQTMGWLGFELSRTPAPMDSHLAVLELAAASYIGQGNVPCYRGPQVFDAASTQVKQMWSLWTVSGFAAAAPAARAATLAQQRSSGHAIVLCLACPVGRPTTRSTARSCRRTMSTSPGRGRTAAPSRPRCTSAPLLAPPPILGPEGCRRLTIGFASAGPVHCPWAPPR